MLQTNITLEVMLTLILLFPYPKMSVKNASSGFGSAYRPETDFVIIVEGRV